MRPITLRYSAEAALAAVLLSAVLGYESYQKNDELWEKVNTAALAGEKPCRVHLGKDPATVILTDTYNGKDVEVKYKVEKKRYTLISPYFHPEMSEQKMIDRKEQLSSPEITTKINAAACKIAARDGDSTRTLQEDIVAKRFYHLNCHPK